MANIVRFREDILVTTSSNTRGSEWCPLVDDFLALPPTEMSVVSVESSLLLEKLCSLLLLLFALLLSDKHLAASVGPYPIQPWCVCPSQLDWMLEWEVLRMLQRDITDAFFFARQDKSTGDGVRPSCAKFGTLFELWCI